MQGGAGRPNPSAGQESRHTLCAGCTTALRSQCYIRARARSRGHVVARQGRQASRPKRPSRNFARDAKVKEVTGNAGRPVLYLDAPEFDACVRADAGRMVDVVGRSGKVK